MGFSGSGRATSRPDVNSVAVIGLACRFPGDAKDAERFWELLCKAKSAYSESDRFNINGFHSSTNEKRNFSTPRGAHFLRDDIGLFDAGFFSISPNEAQAMDPQQRLMLEVAYEAFENAGLPLEAIAGTNTACHVGNFATDYREMIFRDPESAPLHSVSGTGSELISNRLSWFFDLRGPSFTLNTACSSSLVALHQGCQSLRTGESNMALVGGSNLLLNPDMFLALSNQQFLAKDGLSKAFDAKGDGYGRGEGFAAIILKRIDDAIRDKDPIRAIIRSTGVNQDGKTKAIMVPNAEAQEELIRSTYRSAGIDFKHTHYFEAHGTGTKVGDPLELEAISKTLGSERGPSDKIIVGSVKSNIGHLESTAGLAGIIKGIYILERATIPPNIHFKQPSPRIPLDEWNLTVPTKLTPWPVEGLRRMSVQGFGYGGTNAHAILDDAFHYLAERRLQGINFTKASTCTDVSTGLILAQDRSLALNGLSKDSGAPSKISNEKRVRIFVFSAHDQYGLKQQLQSLAKYVQDCSSRLVEKTRNRFLRDLAFTLGERRSRLACRASLTAHSTDELISTLQSGCSEVLSFLPSGKPQIGFIFTGQGAQWAKMGIELHQYRVFRESVENSDEYLRSALGCPWSAMEQICHHESQSNINLPEYSQPLCTILQIAIVDLLESWNIVPSAIAGHSSGEIAAAYCLGALTKEDALKVTYHRGLLSSQIKNILPTQRGAMMAVAASESQAQDWIARLSHGEVVLACINSPSSVTLSGDASGIEELQTILKKEGIFARMLKVDTAYHSPHMEIIAAQYLEAIKEIQTLSRQSRKMFSAVTGCLVDPSELGPMNWVRNLMSPVLFYDATRALLQSMQAERQLTEASPDILLEIGPHAALQGPIGQILKSHSIDNVVYQPVLLRGRNGTESALTAVGALLCQGVPADLSRINNDANDYCYCQPCPLVDLPSYRWNHSRSFFSESRISKQYRSRENPRSSLLGALCPAFGENEKLWRGFLRISEQPWIQDHKIQESILYPAAGYIVMAVEAACQIAAKENAIECLRLREVQISTPAVVTEDSELECILQFRPHLQGTHDSSSAWMEFTVSTCVSGQGLQQNCSGLLLIEYNSEEGTSMSFENKMDDQASREQYSRVGKLCHISEDPKDFYQDLAASGLNYGPALRNVSQVFRSSGKSRCSVDVPDHGFVATTEQDHRTHIIHPATLDAIFHLVFAAHKDDNGRLKEGVIPNSIGEMTISATTPSVVGARLVGSCAARQHGARGVMAEIVMLDEGLSRPVVTMNEFQWEAFSGLSDPMDEEIEPAARKIFSKLIWKPAIELLSSNQQLEILKAATIEALAPLPTERIYRMEMLANFYICRVLDRVSLEMVQASHLQDLYRWMHDQALLRSHEGLDKRTADLFQADLESDGADGETLCQIGKNLESIVLGKLDATELPLDENIMDGLLSNIRGLDECYDQIREFTNLMAHTNPNTSILEFGSATKERVFSALSTTLLTNKDDPEMFQYIFAAPTIGALESAEKHLEPWKNYVKFKTLAIEKDLSSQGFENATFDIIIWSHPFETVERRDKVLSCTRRLLKPEGKICFVSMTNPGMTLPLVSRCLPDLWSKIMECRYSSCLESQPLEAVLKQNNLTPMFVTADIKDGLYQQLGVTVATANGAPKTKQNDKEIVLLEALDPSQASQNLAAQIQVELGKNNVKARRVPWSTSISFLKAEDCISLLELETPMLLDVNNEDFLKLQQLILGSSNLLWINALDNPAAALAPGMARSIRNEIPGKRFRNLAVQTESLLSPHMLAPLIERLMLTGTSDDEFVEENGKLKICRVTEDTLMNGEMSRWLGHGRNSIDHISLESVNDPQKLAIQARGMLDTLCLEADHVFDCQIAHDEVEIEVKATGLNFRDVMVTMGQIPDNLLGFEASGIIGRVGRDVKHFKVGDIVCTLGHGAHRTHFRNKASLCQSIPAGLSCEEGATLPLVHCTAFYSLVYVARARPGQTILIHAAAGGVGQAAIQIAKHLGLEIFATVGSADKRQLIQEVYGLAEDHIFNSRDLSFAKGVKRMTDGRGVDCIINSLSGEALRQTWHCIAPFGTFVEIGMKDILSNTRLEMRPFMQDATFTFFNLKHVMADNPILMAEIMKGTFDFLRRGITKPVSPVTIYSISEVEKAFRLMQTGKHRGKIALTWGAHDIVPVLQSPVPSIKLDRDATYVLVGGLGGLGRSLANLLADLGAGCLCFISRSGDKSGAAQELIQDIKFRNIRIEIYSCDIADGQHLSETLRHCKARLPPIKGLFQCAVVLRDSLFERMTYQQWTESLRPKVQGSWNLHSLLPRDLDFHIALGSFVGIFGNRSQSNYAAANSYKDALAHYRRSRGLKAVTIDLGIMRDVGLLAAGGATDYVKEWEEPFGIREREFHLIIKHILAAELSPGQAITPQIITGFATGGTAQKAGIRRPYYFDDARFSILAKTGLFTHGKDPSSGNDPGRNIPLRDQIAQMDSFADATRAVSEAMIARAAKALQTDRNEINENRPLYSYGIDSLVAVEMVNWVFKEIKVTLSVFDILASMPISSLVHNITAKSPYLPTELKVGQ